MREREASFLHTNKLKTISLPCRCIYTAARAVSSPNAQTHTHCGTDIAHTHTQRGNTQGEHSVKVTVGTATSAKRDGRREERKIKDIRKDSHAQHRNTMQGEFLKKVWFDEICGV